MITLYKSVPAWELPDLSPFAVKLEGHDNQGAYYVRMRGQYWGDVARGS